MVISEVFRDPAPGAPLTGPVMLLAGLRAGIAGQLTVLDDAGLTGTGRSLADVLGVPGTSWRTADRLPGAGDLLPRSWRQAVRPPADELDPQLTRLQIQRLGANARPAGRGGPGRAEPAGPRRHGGGMAAG